MCFYVRVIVFFVPVFEGNDWQLISTRLALRFVSVWFLVFVFRFLFCQESGEGCLCLILFVCLCRSVCSKHMAGS